MTTPENKRSDRSRDEVLAGEYVLGVLPFAERLRVEHRLRQDKAFQAIVNRWQENLASFNTDYVTGEPAPSWLYSSVEERLFKPATMAGPARSLWNSVLLWRGLTAAPPWSPRWHRKNRRSALSRSSTAIRVG
jgi:anti-sigma-K factor RskA